MAYFSPVNWLASTYAPWFLDHLDDFKDDAAEWRRKLLRHPVDLVDHEAEPVRRKIDLRFDVLKPADRDIRFLQGERVWELICKCPGADLVNRGDHARYHVCDEQLWAVADRAAHIAVAEGRLTVAEVEDRCREFAEEIATATA